MPDGTAAKESTLLYIEEFADDPVFRQQVLLALMDGIHLNVNSLYAYGCEVGNLRRRIQIRRIQLLKEKAGS